MTALTGESLKAREALGESATAFEARIQERFEALTAATRLTLDSLKASLIEDGWDRSTTYQFLDSGVLIALLDDWKAGS